MPNKSCLLSATRPMAVALIVVATVCAVPASAGVVVTVDAPTLEKLLSAVVKSEHEVPLTGERTLRVRLDDLRVLGFEPSAEGRPGRILATLAVSAPDLGMNMKLRPRVALDVAKTAAGNMLDIRLEGLEVPLPFGTFDLGRMMPPIRYPSDAAFDLSGTSGDIAVQSVLTGITMDRKAVRFELELEVVDPVNPSRGGTVAQPSQRP